MGSRDPGVAWPDGARVAVGLAFDVDGPTGSVMHSGQLVHSPRYFSRGAYDPFRALPRILKLLREAGLPATFFIPAWIIEQWPNQCQAIVDDGHEVANHGYQHEAFVRLSVDEQHDVLARAQKTFRQYLGVSATGFRAPSADWHPRTPAILLEHGIRYTSTLVDDYLPYRHVIDGQPSPLVELPARLDLDDYAYFAYQRDPDFPPAQDRIASYHLTLDNYIREFDGHREVGGFITTTFHPQVSGTPGRIILLERLFAHMKSRSGGWFARMDDIVEHWLGQPAAVTGPVAAPTEPEVAAR